MVAVGEADPVVLPLHVLAPAPRYVVEAEGFAPFAFDTAACAGLVDIREVGVTQGDAPGAVLANSSALAGAIAAVPHNGTVQVPTGRYLSLPVAMRGSMTLLLAPRCRVCGAAVAGGLAHPPRPRQRWPDAGLLGGPPRNLFRRAAHAIVARRLAIAGPGSLDGGGDRDGW
ncbi:MAG: hypothetical protein CMP09_25040 [Yangia sp.]|nr:hypothetical protein [Salipiger sp.]